MIVFDPHAMTTTLAAFAEALQSNLSAPAALAAAEWGGRAASIATGVSDIRSEAPARADQSFDVASQTKMMTAVAVLRLAEEGRIDLDAPAATWLPKEVVEGVPNAANATVRQLLNMTGGVPNFTNAIGESGYPIIYERLLADPDAPFGNADALDIARDMTASFAAGEEFEYSNTGYILLGLMVEAVTGEAFGEVLAREVFAKAGMDRAEDRPDAVHPDRIRSYLTDPFQDALRDVTADEIRSATVGDGSVVATTTDMIAFLKALLLEGKLLDTASLASMMEMTTSFDLGGDVTGGFGLGLNMFETADGQRIAGFTGGALGTSSASYANLADGVIVSMSATQQDAEGEITGTVIALSQALRDADAWAAYTDDGSAVDVRSGAAGNMTLRAEGDGLTAELDGASILLARTLRAIAVDDFVFADGSVLVVGDGAHGSQRDHQANNVDILRDHAAAADAANHLMGLGGNDRLKGGHGDDRVDGATGNDRLTGREGADLLIGGKGNDDLRGGMGRDRLRGGDGNDHLGGGAGADSLRGGAGADIFIFGQETENGRHETDRIVDFDLAKDAIDLRGATLHSMRDGAQGVTLIIGEDRDKITLVGIHDASDLVFL